MSKFNSHTENTAAAVLPMRKHGHGESSTAGSPHIVIRGETSTSTESPAPLAHIDWLAFTCIPPDDVYRGDIACTHPTSVDFLFRWLVPPMLAALGLPITSIGLQPTGRGWNGYTQRWNIVGDNGGYGLIAFGGNGQHGTVHVELNATACAHVPNWQSVQQWGESIGATITRVDLAHDDLQGQTVSIETAKAWHEAGEFVTSGRPPDAHLHDDLGSGKGKTLYIGSRASGKLLRIYEKGRQLGDTSSPWVRVELELRGKSRLIPWDVLTSPVTYLAGGYPCLAFLSIVQDKICTITKAVQITLESIVQYLRTAGGKSINVLMQANGGNAEAVINAIRRDGIPRRLVNYADFLPQAFAGGGVLFTT